MFSTAFKTPLTHILGSISVTEFNGFELTGRSAGRNRGTAYNALFGNNVNFTSWDYRESQISGGQIMSSIIAIVNPL